MQVKFCTHSVVMTKHLQCNQNQKFNFLEKKLWDGVEVVQYPFKISGGNRWISHESRIYTQMMYIQHLRYQNCALFSHYHLWVHTIFMGNSLRLLFVHIHCTTIFALTRRNIREISGASHDALLPMKLFVQEVMCISDEMCLNLPFQVCFITKDAHHLLYKNPLESNALWEAPDIFSCKT